MHLSENACDLCAVIVHCIKLNFHSRGFVVVNFYGYRRWQVHLSENACDLCAVIVHCMKLNFHSRGIIVVNFYDSVYALCSKEW